ncbi:hypothetical protein [Streptacidiphilus sp. MAP5-52]|uniref:hypothetical protein n=1 Tax=Streptacidiphilus sp. MAP5-52 TaxID=3156267 RepID=UPI003514441D
MLRAGRTKESFLRIHRSSHPSNFVVIPNSLAQNRAMSYTARGLLIDLLSRPDEWRETCRQMADSSPQGRKALESALNELRAFGYYRVELVRLPSGRLVSEVHVYDVPQTTLPGATAPASGAPAPGRCDALLGKNLVKEPSLPEEPEQGPVEAEGQGGRERQPEQHERAGDGEVDEQTRAAVDALYRAVRPERRLRVGAAEAYALAPLVRSWLDRGASEAELRQALLAGLPVVVYSPAGVLRDRLTRKMPPQVSAPPAGRRFAECPSCRDPLPAPGHCRRCSGNGNQPSGTEDGARAEVSVRGAAMARKALRGL